MIKALFALTLLLLNSTLANANEKLEFKWNHLISNTKLDTNKQSYCFSRDGKTFGKNLDLKVRPASVSKIYTTYWALEKLTKYHQFETKFFLKNNDLFIQGGQDPFFVTENLFLLISYLNERGIKQLDNIYFNSSFFLNWSDQKESISQSLLRSLVTRKYSREMMRLKNEVIKLSNEDNRIPALTDFELKVKNVMFKDFSEVDSDDSFTFYSSPLWQHLKQMNIYSNNFYADKIFAFMGGINEFHNFIDTNLNTTIQDIRFETGSGLGENYTTCSVTMNMLKSLQDTLIKNNLKLEQVISVPGSDQGTLANRFTEKEYNKFLVAKTGTLRHTSTLSGYLLGKEKVMFGVFNHTYERTEARKIQNQFIKMAIKEFTGLEPIKYKTPKYISITNAKIQ